MLSKPTADQSWVCSHYDKERLITHRWCTPDLVPTVKKAYWIICTYKVRHFSPKNKGEVPSTLKQDDSEVFRRSPKIQRLPQQRNKTTFVMEAFLEGESGNSCWIRLRLYEALDKLQKKSCRNPSYTKMYVHRSLVVPVLNRGRVLTIQII